MENIKSPRGWAVPIVPSVMALEPEVTGPVSEPMPEAALCVPEMPEECETPVMVFIDTQRWRQVYDMETGLERGTIFPQLDLPFLGEGACRR